MCRINGGPVSECKQLLCILFEGIQSWKIMEWMYTGWSGLLFSNFQGRRFIHACGVVSPTTNFVEEGYLQKGQNLPKNELIGEEFKKDNVIPATPCRRSKLLFQVAGPIQCKLLVELQQSLPWYNPSRCLLNKLPNGRRVSMLRNQFTE